MNNKVLFNYSKKDIRLSSYFTKKVQDFKNRFKTHQWYYYYR